MYKVYNFLNITINQFNFLSIRYLLNLQIIASRHKLADVYFLYKLINNYIDTIYVLENIPFKILAYNNLSSSIFYLPSHITNYLKNTRQFQEPYRLCGINLLLMLIFSFLCYIQFINYTQLTICNILLVNQWYGIYSYEHWVLFYCSSY